jgi:hypothetical protein
LWSTNRLESLKEIKRRTDVVGVFPAWLPCSASRARCLSRSTTNGKWGDRRYLSDGSMALFDNPKDPVDEPTLRTNQRYVTCATPKHQHGTRQLPKSQEGFLVRPIERPALRPGA